MAKDELGYDRIVERQLRGVAREVLAQVAVKGLPGDHHFYITFRTDHPGVSMGPSLKAQFPREITIVLQHQFWGLEVSEDAFAVTLSFSGKHERLHVPFEALVSFTDPSVKFGLQFEMKNQHIELQPAPEKAQAEKTSAEKAQADAPKALPKGRSESKSPAATPADQPGDAPAGEAGKAGTVIALDTFRKKH
ncbi:MAG TPA: ClpXP protease specificity-enhancing factor SspB [Candidatus Cybelea sp.]|nr:ClpXP protease specificity-enhancing factor SspB [Candidatus Cybelea sp.]